MRIYWFFYVCLCSFHLKAAFSRSKFPLKSHQSPPISASDLGLHSFGSSSVHLVQSGSVTLWIRSSCLNRFSFSWSWSTSNGSESLCSGLDYSAPMGLWWHVFVCRFLWCCSNWNKPLNWSKILARLFQLYPPDWRCEITKSFLSFFLFFQSSCVCTNIGPVSLAFTTCSPAFYLVPDVFFGTKLHTERSDILWLKCDGFKCGLNLLPTCQSSVV